LASERPILYFLAHSSVALAPPPGLPASVPWCGSPIVSAHSTSSRPLPLIWEKVPPFDLGGFGFPVLTPFPATPSFASYRSDFRWAFFNFSPIPIPGVHLLPPRKSPCFTIQGLCPQSRPAGTSPHFRPHSPHRDRLFIPLPPTRACFFGCPSSAERSATQGSWDVRAGFPGWLIFCFFPGFNLFFRPYWVTFFTTPTEPFDLTALLPFPLAFIHFGVP